MLNRANASLAVFNRGLGNAAELGPFEVTVSAWDAATGASLPLAPPYRLTAPSWAPNRVTQLPGIVSPPAAAAPNAIILYRVQLVGMGGGGLLRVAEYLLSTLDANQTVPQNLSALVALRHRAQPLSLGVGASGSLRPTPLAPSALFVTVQLAHPSAAGQGIAAAVRVTLLDPAAPTLAATGAIDERILPQWASNGYFALVPGESAEVSIEVEDTPATSLHLRLGLLQVEVAGWNAVTQRLNVTFKAQ
jgi:hypothetical protein